MAPSGVARSLRGYVVLSLCLSTLFVGCLGSSRVPQIERQRQTRQKYIDKVVAAGGKAEYKGVQSFGRNGPAWVIDWSGIQVTDALIDDLAEIGGYVADLKLAKSSITDEQLLRIDSKKLGRVVTNFDISDTAISDASFGNLKNFYCLMKVDAKGTKVTNEGVSKLKQYIQSSESVPKPLRGGPKVELK